MGPSGQTTGRPSSGLKTLPASSGKGISSNRWRSRVKVPRQTIFAMVWWLLNLRASSLEGNFIPDPTQYFPRRALESVCVSATASWPSWPEAREKGPETEGAGVQGHQTNLEGYLLV